ncbi:UV-damaged DNA-binding protein rad7 [Coemansia sp. Cherry 401B]|nr:UV-damaged DNA-binding protein rad7 [Coemansia sp. RSA 2705]KAJ2738693.1 UV-damaged DNA-binding protein rad7 [Coemansia sp. Cherry 401B]
MDPNDRVRGNAGGRASGRGKTTVIRGPNSALTDYLQEIGVTEHFRERRRRENEERERAQAEEQRRQQGQQGESAAAAAAPSGEPAAHEASEATADAALAADMQDEEQEGAAAGPSTVPVKVKRKRKGKKESGDEAEYNLGLNRSSARKGGKMHSCEMCERRFLVRGDAAGRQLCPACRRSVDKAAADKAAETQRARQTMQRRAPAAKRRKMKKTEGGLLEFDSGLPTLQDLCVRVIARHLDQVESFGDISGQSLNRLCRIISKMRVLDEQTLGLFVGGQDRTSVTLYDCTRIKPAGLRRLVDTTPRLESLDLQYCGRLDDAGLLALAQGLPRLAHVRLDGAFLVRDAAWAGFFRVLGGRLRSFSVAYGGFGARAMRALVTHCVRLEALRVAECSDFDDDSVAMLAAPITEFEEIEQEAERLLRAEGAGKGKAPAGAVPAWQPMAQLRALELVRPHRPMASMTARRVVRGLGKQLRVLDLAGFRDLADDFLDDLGASCPNLQELGLASCDSIGAAAMAAYFAGLRGRQALRAGHGFTRVDLSRCYMLTDRVVQELVRHSGATLRRLALNSVDDNLTLNGVLALGGFMYGAEGGKARLEEQTAGCGCLEELDLSWVRCTTDAALEQILPKCKGLAQVSVYGCGGVTAFAPARAGLRYVGRECDTV